jgi:hypothetical protein
MKPFSSFWQNDNGKWCQDFHFNDISSVAIVSVAISQNDNLSNDVAQNDNSSNAILYDIVFMSFGKMPIGLMTFC